MHCVISKGIKLTEVWKLLDLTICFNTIDNSQWNEIEFAFNLSYELFLLFHIAEVSASHVNIETSYQEQNKQIIQNALNKKVRGEIK